MSHHSRFVTPSADNLGKTKAYAWYINSHAWQVKREEFWRNLQDHSCYCCGTPRVPGFHVHHRTYDRFMAEDLDDLVAVCEECHDLIHDLHRHDPKWRARGLWDATDEVRRVRRHEPAKRTRRRPSPIRDKRGRKLKASAPSARRVCPSCDRKLELENFKGETCVGCAAGAYRPTRQAGGRA